MFGQPDQIGYDLAILAVLGGIFVAVYAAVKFALKALKDIGSKKGKNKK